MTTPSYVIPRAYPTREIAIAVFQKAPEHIQEGDLVTVRPPTAGIGMKEAKLWLWILVDGVGSIMLDAAVYEPYDPTGIYKPRSNYIRYDKRRYCAPLARIKQLYPALDLDRARDPGDAYQPFYTLDEDSNLWLTDHTPYAAEGLVFDKVKGVYI